MERRKITARDLMRDIKAGASDGALMNKYSLSAQGLQSVLNKLVKSGVVTQAQLDDRVPLLDRTVDLGLHICPACGHIQSQEFVACPRCGFKAPSKIPASTTTVVRGRGIPGPKRPPTGVLNTGETAARTDRTPTAVSATVNEEPGRDPVVQLSRLVGYCRVFAIAALVMFLVLLATLLFAFGTAEGPATLSSAQLFFGVLALEIPAIILAFVVFTALRAVSEAARIFAELPSPEKKGRGAGS